MVQCYMLAIFSSLSSHLTNHIHPGTGKHVIFTLLHNWIGYCHGQILIETATHSSQKRASGAEARPWGCSYWIEDLSTFERLFTE